jgi:hypothetical protein
MILMKKMKKNLNLIIISLSVLAIALLVMLIINSAEHFNDKGGKSSNKSNKSNNSKPKLTRSSSFEKSKRNELYICDNCKCHKTDAGTLCGKKDRLTGDFHKCKSDCKQCDGCYGADSDDLIGDAGFKTVEPESNLSNVIIDSVKKLRRVVGSK